MRRFIETPRRRGRKPVPSSVGAEATAVEAYLRAGMAQYGLAVKDLWDDDRASTLEHKNVVEGYLWVRTQLSLLKRGGYVIRGVQRGVSHSVQRDLFRLIENHPTAEKWRRAGNTNNWYPDHLRFPALQDELLYPSVAALIDPQSIGILADQLADALRDSKIVTTRRDETRRCIAEALRSMAPQTSKRAASWLPIKYAKKGDAADLRPTTLDTLGLLAERMWPQSHGPG